MPPKAKPASTPRIAANCPVCDWVHWFDRANLDHETLCQSCHAPFTPAMCIKSSPPTARPLRPAEQPPKPGLLLVELLICLSAIAFMGGLAVLFISASALHEIEALILGVIASVFFSAGCVIDVLRRR